MVEFDTKKKIKMSLRLSGLTKNGVVDKRKELYEGR